MLKNYMEFAVDHVLPQLLPVFPDICSCEKCQVDIKAIALNHLKPHYVVTDQGALWSKVEEMGVQYHADVMKALIDAITIVKLNPRHQTKEDL